MMIGTIVIQAHSIILVISDLQTHLHSFELPSLWKYLDFTKKETPMINSASLIWVGDIRQTNSKVYVPKMKIWVSIYVAAYQLRATTGPEVEKDFQRLFEELICSRE